MEAFEYNGKTIVDMFLYSAVVYVLPVGKLRRHVPVEVFEGETRQEAINRVRKEVMGLSQKYRCFCVCEKRIGKHPPMWRK